MDSVIKLFSRIIFEVLLVANPTYKGNSLARVVTGISMATFSVEVFYQLLCSRHGDWYINGYLQCWSLLPAAVLPTWRLVYQWLPSVLKSFTSCYAPDMATGISMATFSVEVFYQLLCSRHGDWYINGYLQCWSLLPAAMLPTWRLVYQWLPSVLKSFTSC